MTGPRIIVSRLAVDRFAERAGVDVDDVAAEIVARAHRCIAAAERIGMGGHRFVIRTGRVRLLIDQDVVVTALPRGLWWAPDEMTKGGSHD